jgi:hypothetical protein
MSRAAAEAPIASANSAESVALIDAYPLQKVICKLLIPFAGAK